MRPPSYREQKACANCRHAWEFDDWKPDGAPVTLNVCVLVIGPPPEPPPTDIAISERESAMDAFLVADKAWDEKSKRSRVSDIGICDQHEPKPPQV